MFVCYNFDSVTKSNYYAPPVIVFIFTDSDEVCRRVLMCLFIHASKSALGPRKTSYALIFLSDLGFESTNPQEPDRWRDTFCGYWDAT
ncbi:hypothetical protein K443DRAFT_416962 [Laccaria amethystina LaAM-08-1]|uniref:Uncharacterized protein n=1 Tax=Laccaria amethystina LaAM-08-1 TaxID=1095629 RepID=A0A0C9Y2Z9_9AGAR|nr:hypothetical protein K443DRAFT_416962 [Laccaria amethystina LaAM-08-1]